MLLYLKDCKEGRTIRFTNDEVQNYCELFNLEFTGNILTLMCAKLWPEFKIYNSFINNTIVLVETQIKEIHKLATN